MDSPVEAGEVADEVRQKGGAPAEGVSKNIGYGMPRRGGLKAYFLTNVIPFFRVTAFLFPKKEQLLSESVFPSSGIILFRELRLSHAGLS